MQHHWLMWERVWLRDSGPPAIWIRRHPAHQELRRRIGEAGQPFERRAEPEERLLAVARHPPQLDLADEFVVPVTRGAPLRREVENLAPAPTRIGLNYGVASLLEELHRYGDCFF